MELFDVIIIGGGPAGLNAAVVLGRCHRKVILFDKGEQRNLRSSAMHNYLTRDAIKPSEFISLARKEAKKYGVILQDTGIAKTKKLRGYFEVTDEKGRKFRCKKILFATGLADTLPEVKGLKELYGISVFHCPYCDGWEVSNKNIAVYARKNGFELGLSLTTWSPNITYFTDGKKYLKPEELELLEEYGIHVITTPIRELKSRNGKLKAVILKDDKSIPCDAMFFANGYTQQSDLVAQLGCTISKKKVVLTNRMQQTNIPGVYVAGDASRDMHFVVVAAAEGAKAGVTINKELQKEKKRRKKRKLEIA